MKMGGVICEATCGRCGNKYEAIFETRTEEQRPVAKHKCVGGRLRW